MLLYSNKAMCIDNSFSHLLCHVCSKPACRQLTRGQLEHEALWNHHQSVLNDVLVCHTALDIKASLLRYAARQNEVSRQK
jgi:hypothetical protein